MKTLTAVTPFWLVLTLAGCAVPTPPPPPIGDQSPDDRRVAFDCGPGEGVEMRFFPAQGVAVLVRQGQNLELQQVPAASGFRYTNGPTTVRGKGNELTLEIGRMAPIHCRAR